jgi:hypothetical protein
MKLQPVHLVRWGIPIGLLIAGAIIVWGTDIEGVGEALIAAAVCVWVANALFRFAFSDSKDRVRDEENREFYDRHGHWPDEPPPGQ